MYPLRSLPLLPVRRRGFEPQIPLEHMRPVIGARAVEQATIRFPVEPARVERPVGESDEVRLRSVRRVRRSASRTLRALNPAVVFITPG